MAGSMVYRLEAGPVDSPEMPKFRAAMTALQSRLDNRSYNFIAGFHGAPAWYCWHHQINPRTQVQARLFLPWHRAYLWTLEQMLQDQVAGVALPWWDWTTTQGVPSAYTDTPADGSPNPLVKYHMVIAATRDSPAVDRDTTRDAGNTPGVSLPTAGEIERLLDDPDWASFSDQLENYHDGVHGWVGGDMGDLTTAAYDPLFYAHHCMIDRLWYLWQVRYGLNNIQHELLDLPLPPFNKAVRDTIDVQALGYEYAVSTSPAVAPPPEED